MLGTSRILSFFRNLLIHSIKHEYSYKILYLLTYVCWCHCAGNFPCDDDGLIGLKGGSVLIQCCVDFCADSVCIVLIIHIGLVHLSIRHVVFKS